MVLECERGQEEEEKGGQLYEIRLMTQNEFSYRLNMDYLVRELERRPNLLLFLFLFSTK